MFLRSTSKKIKGRTYRYWKLVENYRTEQGVRQRVVAHLGDLSAFTAEDWRGLAERMGQAETARALQWQVERGGKRGRPRKTVLDLTSPAVGESDTVAIRLSSVRWKNARSFGDVYVSLQLWKRLGLERLLKEQLTSIRAEVPMDVVAALLAANRLVAPRSELGMVRWCRTTALPELLGIPLAKIHENRLYRCLDVVWKHKEAIEAHLAGEGQRLFAQDYSVLLYDLTSTYFEGQALRNAKTKRGYSRDHRPDCKQVCIGVVVDREGFPLGMEVLRGNVRDHETVSDTLRKLEKRFGSPKASSASAEGNKPARILCMDRGMLTDDNLGELRRAGYRYVLADRRSESRHHWEEIVPQRWEVLHKDTEGKPLIEVQEVGEEDGDRLVMVRSAGCGEKEKGIHDRFLARFTAALEKLANQVSVGRLKDPAKIHQRLGRLLERHPGVSRWVHVQLLQDDSGQRLHWCVKPEAEQQARGVEGVYLLRTNVREMTAQQVWETYILLVRIENTFRTLKHDLNLRPIFHHKEDRAEAHLFVSFLAYAMLWTLEREHRRRGGKLTGRRLLEVLHEIQLATVTMSTADGQPLELQRIGSLTKEQQEILATLNIQLPKTDFLGQPEGLIRTHEEEPA